jgi:Methyltransferase domain
MEPVRLNLGCGTTFAADSLDEVIASSVLEHLYSPFPALDEIHRVMKTSARLLVRVPALGSRAAHRDHTHRFLNNLKGWREILGGYFEHVKVSSEGTRHRDNEVLTAINVLLVKVCRFHELAQVWTFRCSGKRVPAQHRNTGLVDR